MRFWCVFHSYIYPSGSRGCVLTRMQIFEQSQFASELGAAVHLAPNANGILKRLGIHAEDFGSNPMQVVSFQRREKWWRGC